MKRIKVSNKSILVIYGHNNEICIDSRDIAKEFGRRHDNVMQTINNLLADGTISLLECKERKYMIRGREYPCYELNEAGFLTAMPFIGGKKSREGQRRLIKEFLQIRSQLNKQASEREKLAYQVARLTGKDTRMILTDQINRFIVYAQKQGSKNANNYYQIITKECYKNLLILDSKASQIRELLSPIQLSQLNTIELQVADSLENGMVLNQPYKDIYQSFKNTLSSLNINKSKLLE